MIGQFTYSDEAPCSHVILNLAWDGSAAVGRVAVPGWARSALRATHGCTRDHDEYMRLGIALSYGVLLATAAGLPLTITGDRSAWPAEWGELVDHLWQPSLIISH